MQKHSLKVVNRSQSNKGSLKRLRSSGKIPGNIYSKGNARAITVSAVAFRTLNKEIGGGASLVELEDETGETALTNIQSVQVNAVSRVIEHIDFREVARGESFVARVPVQLVGAADCIGVKHDGGVIDHKTLELEIRCRPSKLPEGISVNISELYCNFGPLNILLLERRVEYSSFPLRPANWPNWEATDAIYFS